MATGIPSPYEYTPSQAEMVRLYDLYRSALLSKKYHAHRLNRARLFASVTETVAALASSSAIASLAIWRSEVGNLAFAVLLVLAAAASVIRSSFGLSGLLDRHSRMAYAWNELALDMDKLIAAIRRENGLGEIRHQQAIDLADRFQHVEMQEEPGPKRLLLIKLQKEVDESVPSERLWLPAA